ncbi:MAG: RNA-directed DNA polymerase [Patescibacteria group bacterium]
MTSQIFANIYLNELDQFAKHELKIKHYFRYTDDFIIVHNKSDYLQEELKEIEEFLENRLLLELHSNKVSIKKFRQGVDFLGYVILPHYKILRAKTRRRMFKKLFQKERLIGGDLLCENKFNQAVQSYLGILSHCNGYEVETVIRNRFGGKKKI